MSVAGSQLPLGPRAEAGGPIKIFLIDDNSEARRRLAEILEPLGAAICCASDGVSGIVLARREAPDLILLDFEMQGLDGLGVLERLRELPELEHTPVLFATGDESNEVLTACFHARASDYIRKPYGPEELRARVQAMLDRYQLVGRLQRMALQDDLTGLPNRANVRDSIQAAIDDRRGADDRTFAVLFVILLQDRRGTDDAIRVAERLLDVFAEPSYLGGHEVCSTASIGLVVADGSYTKSDEILRDADTAMYAAKAAGKARFVEFKPHMRACVEGHLRLEAELRIALAVGQFVLDYQPIISLDSGRTHGLEALVRWEHPQHGLIAPADFIPVAEETGMILALGEWVLHEALGQFAAWRKTLGRAAPETLHVNLALQQLRSGELVAQVLHALELHRVAPGDLFLEVTESEIMHDPEAATQALGALRHSGVQVAMDNFGTGYSSLSCPHDFPRDVLKIDRSFSACVAPSRSSKKTLLDFALSAAAALGLSSLAPTKMASSRYGRFFNRGLLDVGLLVGECLGQLVRQRRQRLFGQAQQRAHLRPHLRCSQLEP